MADADRCVMCGGIVIEGYGHVCPVCQRKYGGDYVQKTIQETFSQKGENRIAGTVRDTFQRGDKGHAEMDCKPQINASGNCAARGHSNGRDNRSIQRQARNPAVLRIPEKREKGRYAMRRENGKNPVRQIVGYHNREAGRQFEGIIKAANDFYSQNGIAEVDKTPEPMRTLYPLENGRFVACFEKKAQPDFKGTLYGGKCICFEAKHTEQGKITQNEVTDTQAETLDKYEKMRARCFVLVSFGFFTFHMIPWGVWKQMRAIFGHKYMTPQEAEPYRVRFKYGILDYLGYVGAKKTQEVGHEKP